jgi:HKD family nuclease
MINAAKTFILDMGIKAWMMNREIKNVLAQLKDLKNSDVKSQDVTNDYLKDDDNEDLKNPAIIEPDEIEVIPNDAIATT